VIAQEAFSDLFQAAGSYEIGASQTFFYFCSYFLFFAVANNFLHLAKGYRQS
jgi:hypothetical protein